MRNFQEILQSLRPIQAWKRWRGKPEMPLGEDFTSQAGSILARTRAQSLTLKRPEKSSVTEWRPIDKSESVRRVFIEFRDFIYECNRRTKHQPGETPRALWESGKLAGGRQYFYLQPWNERGFLFEEAPRGWVVSRADKITSQTQFMRERSAWDFVLLYEAADKPDLLRVKSELMGEGIVSFTLYQDFMSQAFKPLP